jgi:RteC protein
MFEYYCAGYDNNDHVIFRKNFEERNIFTLIQGTQMIEDFLYNANDPRTFEEKLKDYPKFKWTGTKIQAVILVNLMVKGNLINNGNVTITDLMEHFQITFNIDLKDFYKKYQDNINSDDPFKFLDFMKTIIENDIEKNLEKP